MIHKSHFGKLFNLDAFSISTFIIPLIVVKENRNSLIESESSSGFTS